MERKVLFFLLIKAGSSSTLQRTSLFLCTPLFPSHSPDMEMGTRKTALSRGAEVVAALPSRYLVQPRLSDTWNSLPAQPGVPGQSLRTLLLLACFSLPVTFPLPLCSSRKGICQSEPLDRLEGGVFQCGGWRSHLEVWFQVAARQQPLGERGEHLRQVWQLCFEHSCCSYHSAIIVQADGRPYIGGFMQIYANQD